MSFLNKYNQYKIKYTTICEGTVKSLIPLIQQDLLNGKKYQDLTDKQKERLQRDIENECAYVQSIVEDMTSNKQYQSWLYDILAQADKNIAEDYEVIEQCLKHFEQLCRRPDLTANQKNIQNYKTFQDLQQFILDFQTNTKFDKKIYNCFKLLYSNNKFDIYLINENQYEDCNRLFGGNDYFNTGWCVAKSESYFNNYLTEYQDNYNGYIVWITKLDNKPFGLLHYGSGQFKDCSDKAIKDQSDEVLDVLIHLNDAMSWYDITTSNTMGKDLLFYSFPLWKYQNPNLVLGQYIAEQIGGKFDIKNKVLDCCNKQFKFENQWLDQDGTFDFTIINATNNWSSMFRNCERLSHLPENFIIPEGVMNTYNMFESCKQLEWLPKNFTIPNTVINCSEMFYGCFELTELPQNFRLGNSVQYCTKMFGGCTAIQKLPEGFTIPPSVNGTYGMFTWCVSLQSLPDGFTIPNSVETVVKMFEGCRELKSLPKGFSIPANCDQYMAFSATGIK